MGSYTSRLFSHHYNEHEAKTKNHQTNASPCGAEKTRLCTPPITKRKFANDPRSATIGIVRTPIEVTCTPPGITRRVASALPKYLQGKRYLETDFDSDVPTTTPEKCLPDPRSPNFSQQRTPIIVKSVVNYISPVITVNQAPEMDTPEGVRAIVSALDPRSPATDFDRTPILKPKSTERAATSTEKSLDPITESDVGNARFLYCETTTDYSIPEIHTVSECIPARNESSSLEDRLDSCEISKTSTSSHVSSEEMSDDGSENEEQITVIRNPKVLTSYPDALSTWTEDKLFEGGDCGDGGGDADDDDDDVADEKTDGVDESLGKTLDNNISEIINAVIKSTVDEEKAVVTSNVKIKVWRDSVSPKINEETKKNGHKTTEEIIIEFDDETIVKNSKTASAAKVTGKFEDDTSRNQVKKKKSQQHLNGENKPLADERKIFNNEGKNPIEAPLNRTPLGNRSNNRNKQLQLLSAKSPQQLLRNKGLSTRTIQQENTPPTERFISKTKPHGIQWDPDTTVII